MPYGGRDKADWEGLLPPSKRGNLNFWDDSVSSQGGSNIKQIIIIFFFFWVRNQSRRGRRERPHFRLDGPSSATLNNDGLPFQGTRYFLLTVAEMNGPLGRVRAVSGDGDYVLWRNSESCSRLLAGPSLAQGSVAQANAGVQRHVTPTAAKLKIIAGR